MADASHPKTTKAPHKRVGSVVRGKYRVEAFLATGTMANVYAATHRNGAKVALKILHPQLAQDPGLCERFKREGYFANSIGHPGIVRAIDDDVTEDGCAFLVMELLEGETLEERRRRKGGKLPLSWVLPVADSLLEILGAAHAREVVHRDLKPDNVFVTKEGAVKVLDFGVARWNDNKSSSDMTGVGMVLGTPAYMPPEQALGRREDVNAQSDLWAVGATLFVVLTGEPVHTGGDAKAKLIATARTAARPIREAAPEIPRSVAAVIDRALAFHKQERWPDADAMREALRWARMSVEGPGPVGQVAAASGLDIDPVPPPVPTRRNVDDEPTVARAAPAPIDAADFMTSAPPITLRDAPGASGASGSGSMPISSLQGEPVFSLRREKGPGEPDDVLSVRESPSTERLPKADAVRDIEMLKAALAAESVESGAHRNAMPSYDPADTMGGDEPSSPADEPERSIEVNLSFTRPMAAMVMPDEFASPRPAAGAPPPVYPSGHPSGHPSPSPHVTGPPQQAFASGPPQHAYSSGPPQAAPHPTPYPAAHLAPPVAASSGLTSTHPLYSASASGSTAVLGPSPPASSRPSLAPDAPGPVLGQIVKPGTGRFARIAVPIILALLATTAVVVVLRSRAANARDSGALKGAVVANPSSAGSIVSAPPPPGGNVASTQGAAQTGATDPARTPPTPPNVTNGAAASPAATAPSAAAPAPTASVAVVKKPRRKPKPKPTADQGSEAPPAAAATPETPPETAPKDPVPETPPPAPDPKPTSGQDGF